MYTFLNFRRIIPDDAKLLLHWRLAPHVSKYMLTDISSDLERQKAWIIQSNSRSDYQHSIIQIEGKDVGYTSITVTDAKNGIGEIGAYIGDEKTPRALSAYNFVRTLNHAFFTMNLHKLVNHIIAENARIIKAQSFNGYRFVGVMREHALKNGIRHDLHVFEQTKSEWIEFRKKFRDNHNWWGEELGPTI